MSRLQGVHHTQWGSEELPCLTCVQIQFQAYSIGSCSHLAGQRKESAKLTEAQTSFLPLPERNFRTKPSIDEGSQFMAYPTFDFWKSSQDPASRSGGFKLRPRMTESTSCVALRGAV